MPIFYKRQSNGDVEQVNVPDSQKTMLLNSGWSLTPPAAAPATPKPSNTEVVTGNVTPFVGATPNVVEDTYLDEMLREVEEESKRQRANAQQGYNTLVQHLKEGRDLWNKDLEKTYGRTLEKANVNVYDRGVQDSGIKTRQTTEISDDKAYQTEQQDLVEKQKMQIADQSLKQSLDSIARSEARTRASYKSPYAEYSYS